jgi:hypothetical protein
MPWEVIFALKEVGIHYFYAFYGLSLLFLFLFLLHLPCSLLFVLVSPNCYYKCLQICFNRLPMCLNNLYHPY